MSELMWHAFVRSKDWMHLGIYPYTTLCGMEFDGKGQGVTTPSDVFELRKEQSPFVGAESGPVTCPMCVEIIRLCKIIDVEDLPEKHHLTEEEQDEMLKHLKE